MEYRYTTSRNTPNNDFALISHIVHNAEGYVKYAYIRSSVIPKSQMPPRLPIVIQTQYYYHRDHLGNNCAVWDATNDSIIQRTWYYASGTPMPVSTAQGVHPYKYNGKEYVETHGYDTYDYGFRGYYATIGRFTSIDPLTERTPWQSPYTYANNNWVNLIDCMGLAGSDAYTTSDQSKITKLLEYLSGGGDINSFDFDEEGWDACEVGKWRITFEGEIFYVYSVMEGDITGGMGAGYILPECVVTLIHTKANVPIFMKIASQMSENHNSNNVEQFLNSVGNTISFCGNINCNELYWFGKNGNLYTINQRLKGSKGNYVYNRSYQLTKNRLKPLKILGNISTTIGIVYEVGSIVENKKICLQTQLTLSGEVSLLQVLVLLLPLDIIHLIGCS